MTDNSTSFEVYVLQRGRWELHGRHTAARREASIHEAKTLDKLPGVEAVKVIRDVYNASDGTSAEYTVYKSPGSPQDGGGGKSRRSGRGNASGRDSGGSSGSGGFRASANDAGGGGTMHGARAPFGGTRKSSSSKLFFKLIVIAIASLIVAGMITWVAALAISELPQVQTWIGRDSYADLLFAVFAVAFMLGIAVSAYTFVKKEDLDIDSRPRAFADAEASAWQTALKPKPLTPQQKRALAKAAERNAAAMVAETKVAPEAKIPQAKVPQADNPQTNNPQANIEPPGQPTAAPATQDMTAGKAPEQTPGPPEKDANSPKRGIVLAKSAEEEARPRGVVLSAGNLPSPSAGAQPPRRQLSAAAERHKVELMTFLSKGLESVMRTRPQLDAFNKFGVNLYLAGACEMIGSKRRLDALETSRILRESVEVLGTKREMAMKFADSYESYLIDPKYLGMIEAGRNAMQKHLAEEEDASRDLEPALENWNKPKDQDDVSSGTIAVMFTDIVGSTDMTQTHGDAAAQEVVRTHNRIVRAALTMFDGKEVKHTGDGIMASFNNTAKAVEGGIYIQNQVAASNATNPAVPLGVKIGINAGEPIVEDDDLFGTTVQLSARIVDKAKNYQILVSGTVRGICQGKDFRFVNRGAREMKGFKEPIVLFEAIWDANAVIEPEELAVSPPTESDAAQPLEAAAREVDAPAQEPGAADTETGEAPNEPIVRTALSTEATEAAETVEAAETTETVEVAETTEATEATEEDVPAPAP